MGILIRMKGPSIKTNIRKISAMLMFVIQIFKRGLVYLQERIYQVKKLAILMFSGTPCIYFHKKQFQRRHVCII